MTEIQNCEEAEKQFSPVLEKFNLFVGVTQSGKTFVAISKIIDELNNDEKEGKSLHIVFTMNTLLGNAQFSQRLESIKDSILVFASSKKTGYKTAINLDECKGCMFKYPSVILMCSNMTRFNDLTEIIEYLEKQNFPEYKRVFVYFDELDAYINTKVKEETLRQTIEEIHKTNIVKEILAMTATPSPIFSKEPWKKINIYPSDFRNREIYAGYDDMKFIDPEYNLKTVDYIEKVLNENQLLQRGNIIFAPADIAVRSHQNLKDIIFQINNQTVVIVINSKEKLLCYYKDDEKLEVNLVSKIDELSKTIPEIIKKNLLTDRPIVITGFLCVMRGQTLMSENLGSFTHSIFAYPGLNRNNDYQIFGRITGRTKKWEKTQALLAKNRDEFITIVYCPKSFADNCRDGQTNIFNIIGNENNIIDLGIYEGKKIIKEEPKKSKVEIPITDRCYQVFETIEEANSFAKKYLRRGEKFTKFTLVGRAFVDGKPMASTGFRKGEEPKEIKKEELREKFRKGEIRNMTTNEIIKKLGGLGKDKDEIRMYPNDQFCWVVYWKRESYPNAPSLE